MYCVCFYLCLFVCVSFVFFVLIWGVLIDWLVWFVGFSLFILSELCDKRETRGEISCPVGQKTCMEDSRRS